jgi:hypothetical protein
MRAIHKRKLTPLDATRLRPRPRAFLVWDSLERGLALQVQPSGYRAYKFIYRHRASSKSRWFHIGPADTVSLSHAQRKPPGSVVTKSFPGSGQGSAMQASRE